MYFYNARYYDSALGRFVQADTIVPSPANPQSLNRYAYVLNNPLRYIDPSGHLSEEQIEQWTGHTIEWWRNNYQSVLDLLYALILGDFLHNCMPYDGSGSSEIKYINWSGTATLDNYGYLVFQKVHGGSFTSVELAESGASLSNATLWRPDASGPKQVYSNGKYLNGWGPATKVHTSVMKQSDRNWLVAGVAATGAVVGTGVTLLAGPLVGATVATSV